MWQKSPDLPRMGFYRGNVLIFCGNVTSGQAGCPGPDGPTQGAFLR